MLCVMHLSWRTTICMQTNAFTACTPDSNASSAAAYQPSLVSGSLAAAP